MIKKVNEVVEQLKDPQYVGYEERILSIWAKSIISECTEKAEVKVAPGNGYAYVNKKSITDVINQLK